MYCWMDKFSHKHILTEEENKKEEGGNQMNSILRIHILFGVMNP